MDLFLLRHGAAESFAQRDSDRALTAAGREQLMRVLVSSQDDLAQVTLIGVSPFLRARQTCEIVMEHLPQSPKPELVTLNTLTPSANPVEVADWLITADSQCVLLVSHQPLIGTLLNDLCGFEPGRYRMGTGALARIHMDIVAFGVGQLEWLRQE